MNANHLLNFTDPGCKSRTPFPSKYPQYKWPDSDSGLVEQVCPNMMQTDNITKKEVTWICGLDGNWVGLPDLR